MMDEAELLGKAIRVLIRDLGPVEATRLVSLLPLKRVESVKRHRAWRRKLDKDAFFAEVFGRKR